MRKGGRGAVGRCKYPRTRNYMPPSKQTLSRLWLPQSTRRCVKIPDIVWCYNCVNSVTRANVKTPAKKSIPVRETGFEARSNSAKLAWTP